MRLHTPFAAPAVALAAALAALAALTAAPPAWAAPFEIAIMPSRFELAAKSGARLGQTLDIHNVGTTPTEVSVRTLDWSYSPEGEIGTSTHCSPAVAAPGCCWSARR
jgi:fimbrial chaperone protein